MSENTDKELEAARAAFAAEIDQIHSDCRTLFGQLALRQHFDVQDKKEPIIYHYTTGDSAELILGSGRIFGTDFRCLNDPEELQNGLAAFEAALTDLHQDLVNLDPNKEWRAPRLRIDFDNESDFLITSFSLIGDDLGQWRSYSGAEECGCSLGFDFYRLGGVLNHSGFPNIMQPVMYDDKDKQTYLQALLNAFRPKITSLPESGDPGFQAWYMSRTISNLLTEFACFSKQSGFRSEREFRLLTRLPHRFPTYDKIRKIRQGAYGETPYVEVDLTGEANHVVVDEIVFSPTTTEKARGRLLATLNEQGTVLNAWRQSRVQYRS